MWRRSHSENHTHIAKEGTCTFGHLHWSGADFQNGEGDVGGMVGGGEVSKGGFSPPHPRAVWILIILYNMITGLVQQDRVHKVTRKVHVQRIPQGGR